MHASELGTRQRKILEFIISSVETRGYPPSVREIAQAVGLTSPSTVHAHLEALQRKGYLKKDATKPRAIEVRYSPDLGTVAKRPAVRHVPLVGRVAAGSPTLATEDVEDVLPLPASMIGEGTFFMLRVRGESMIGVGIHEGDYVVVRKQDDADAGDIVVALLEDEATVKTLVRNGGVHELRPENPTMSPIPVGPDSRILGKVVALLRTM